MKGLQMEQMQPMSVGQIIDRAFRLYRGNFVRFITVIAIVEVPLMLLGVFLQRIIQSHAGVGSTLLAGIAVLVVSVIANALGQGALVKTISESYLGNSVSVEETYRFVLPKMVTLIGASFLVGLVVLVGFVLLIVPGVIFSLQLAMTTLAVVLEDKGATAAMGRSKFLASGNLGKVFLVFLVVWIIGAIVGFIFGFIGAHIAPPTVYGLGSSVAIVPSLIQQLFNLVGTVLVAPISAAALILLYYDLRIRKEGFDLEMLARDLGRPATAGADQAPPMPPAPPQA